METYKLYNGVEIPKVGFGTWQISPGKPTADAVRTALEAGYRHLDTAQTYQNEHGLAQGIKDSGVDRDEIFITSKVWNTAQSYQGAKEHIQISLERMGLEYIDLMLIHWPTPVNLIDGDRWVERNAEVWRAMEELYEEGVFRAIGVSNFYLKHLDALKETAKIKPHVNQIKICPGYPQTEVVDYCQANDILVEGYSPLGSGGLFSNQEIKDIAAKYDRTPAQVALRWQLDRGLLPLPRSQKAENIKSNLDIFDFELSTEDIEAISNIDMITSSAIPEEIGY